MDAIYPNKQCADVYTSFATLLKEYETADPAKGKYEIKENNSGDYIWAMRTSATLVKFHDDVLFEFAQIGLDCSVTAKSNSRATCYYDYHTNYCNLYNVLAHADPTVTSMMTDVCKWVPKNPAKRCTEY